jgi:two-component system, chemotaxis family, chemotaxis protein CheY
MKILIVDDSFAMRQIHKRILAELGQTDFAEASSGEAAIEVATQGGIDLILMDVRMQGLSGLETLKKLKEESAPAVPVVMVTTESNKSIIMKAIKNGADGYVFKPITVASMREALEPFLNRS